MSDLKEWIDARSVRDDDSGCLVWKLAGAHGKEPQGRYMGKVVLVRRLVIEESRGKPVDYERTVKCTCETPMCVERKHLVVKQRVGRKGQKWTMAERQRIANATRKSRRGKLTLQAIEDIRQQQEPRTVYAERYNIAPEYVTDIQSFRTWKDYSSPFAGLGG